MHVNFLWDDDEELPRVKQAIARMFREVLALRGTISGEHGIGRVKREYVGLELDATARVLMQAIKKQFDPLNILNPELALPAD